MAYSRTSNYGILRNMCRLMKLTGLGDYWYEHPDDQNLLYWWYIRIVFLSYFLITFFELLEATFNTYPLDLHNDAVAIAAGHSVVLMRLLATVSNKKKIRDFNQFLVEDCRSNYEDEQVMERQYKKIGWAMVLQVVAVYSTVSMYILEGFRRKFIDGDSFIVFAVYWPTYEDTSYEALGARILIIIIFLYIMAAMIAADSLVITHFIMLAFKLENLRRYFKTIEVQGSSLNVPTAELKSKCLEGMLLHQKIVSSATRIQDCFGFMMSVQILQGSSVAVLVLLKLALTSELTITVTILNLTFVIGLFIQLALYLWSAGEITFQASLMSEAIFYCGWERRRTRTQSERDLRRVVLMGIAQAQRPLLMKAFGVQDLSYQTFVMVIRSTYSLFAVILSTKKKY